NSPARYSGLAAHRCDIRKSEHPRDSQMRQVGGGQASELARLKARVRDAVAPAIPACSLLGIEPRRRSSAGLAVLERWVERLCAECAPACEFCNGATLRDRERCALSLHLPLRERVEDRLGRIAVQHL